MRVTERAQKAVLYARQEADRLGHDHIHTEHLLLSLLRDEECLAVATLGELGLAPETVFRWMEEATGQNLTQQQAEQHRYPGNVPMTKPALLVLTLAGREASQLEHDRIGTEHLLLGLASEGEGVAAQVLQDLGGGLLELRQAATALFAAGADPEPFPPDRGPPPWEPPPSAQLRRVVPLAQEHPLPSGDQLALISLEVWSDWFDLRYAIVYATPEPEGERSRPPVLGICQVSDPAGTDYSNRTSSAPAYGMVRIHQRTFVPAPPPGTEQLELRFSPPSTPIEESPPLLVITVDLERQPSASG